MLQTVSVPMCGATPLTPKLEAFIGMNNGRPFITDDSNEAYVFANPDQGLAAKHWALLRLSDAVAVERARQNRKV